MARIRTIKPEFCTSDQLGDCSPTARLLFVLMWMHSDDFGNHPAKPLQLKAECFPLDPFTREDMNGFIDELIENGLIVSYQGHDGRDYWHVTGWHHQKIEKPLARHPRYYPPERGVVEESSTPLEKRRGVVEESSTPLEKRRGVVEESSTPLGKRRGVDDSSPCTVPYRNGMEGSGGEREGPDAREDRIESDQPTHAPISVLIEVDVPSTLTGGTTRVAWPASLGRDLIKPYQVWSEVRIAKHGALGPTVHEMNLANLARIPVAERLPSLEAATVGEWKVIGPIHKRAASDGHSRASPTMAERDAARLAKMKLAFPEHDFERSTT